MCSLIKGVVSSSSKSVGSSVECSGSVFQCRRREDKRRGQCCD
jgi:hypothetical protein